MENRFEIQGNCLIIHLPKEVDHMVSDEIRKESDEIIRRKYIRTITFDFSDTACMDSSGIGLIMGRYKKMHLTGRIAIVAPCRNVERILQISGLYKIVTVFGELGEAIESCEVHDDQICAGGGRNNAKY